MASGAKNGGKGTKGSWDARLVRSLRRHLGLTQQQLAQELGTRQQTISEWETGVYRPRGTAQTLLHIIAERAQFPYAAPQRHSSDTAEGTAEDQRGGQ